MNEIGICGKIPSRGDFLTQGLATGFVESWNEWLQAIMAVSREQLERRWLESYLVSPIWHFALSAGVCGKEPVMGCLMPSVDQVGRHFPLTLAREMLCTPVQARLQGNWSDILQQQALLTLEDEFHLEPWLTSLQQTDINWPEQRKINAAVMPQPKGRPAWVIQSTGPLDAMQLLHHSYRQQFERYCLWWTDGSEQIPACTLVSNGLPQVSQYAAMLTGDWQRWHWQPADIHCSGSLNT